MSGCSVVHEKYRLAEPLPVSSRDAVSEEFVAKVVHLWVVTESVIASISKVRNQRPDLLSNPFCAIKRSISELPRW